MGRGVILVRHAMPEVVQGVSSTLWWLGESAREDCVLLAHALPDGLTDPMYSSTEPKAAETAAVIALRRGLRVEHDAAFAEVDRPTTWDEDYQAAAREYLTRGERPGWEPAHQVLARFTAGVQRAMAATGAGDLLVANHGMALSIYAASVGSINLVPFWGALTFPDAWRLDLESGTVARLFEGGLPTG
ncbi:MAG: hypothetical protein C0506_15725 [Anaerolinea sp.]|nr:hypothetical protein [Anaerolinea sp.]